MDLQRFPVLFLLVFRCHAVVPVHPVLRRFAVGQETPQGQTGIIQLSGVVGGLCHGNDVWLSKVMLKSARLNLTAENLFMLKARQGIESDG